MFLYLDHVGRYKTFDPDRYNTLPRRAIFVDRPGETSEECNAHILQANPEADMPVGAGRIPSESLIFPQDNPYACVFVCYFFLLLISTSYTDIPRLQVSSMYAALGWHPLCPCTCLLCRSSPSDDRGQSCPPELQSASKASVCVCVPIPDWRICSEQQQHQLQQQVTRQKYISSGLRYFDSIITIQLGLFFFFKMMTF